MPVAPRSAGESAVTWNAGILGYDPLAAFVVGSRGTRKESELPGSLVSGRAMAARIDADEGDDEDDPLAEDDRAGAAGSTHFVITSR